VPVTLFAALLSIKERISCFIHCSGEKAFGPKIESWSVEAKSTDEVQYSCHCTIE